MIIRDGIVAEMADMIPIKDLGGKFLPAIHPVIDVLGKPKMVQNVEIPADDPFLSLPLCLMEGIKEPAIDSDPLFDSLLLART